MSSMNASVTYDLLCLSAPVVARGFSLTNCDTGMNEADDVPGVLKLLRQKGGIALIAKEHLRHCASEHTRWLEAELCGKKAPFRRQRGGRAIVATRVCELLIFFFKGVCFVRGYPHFLWKCNKCSKPVSEGSSRQQESGEDVCGGRRATSVS